MIGRSPALPGRTDDEIVAALSAAARRVAEADAGPGPTPDLWRRLQRLRSSGGRPRTWRAALAVGGLAAVAGLALGGRGLPLRQRPITFDAVGPGATRADASVRAADAPADIRFSDGTRIHMQARSDLSVLSSGPRGAWLRMDDGEAHLEVNHRPGASWRVEVGPYLVQVIGTVFDVRWSIAEQTAEVWLAEGSIAVTGPLLGDRVTLRPGNHLVARLGQHDVEIDEARHHEPAGARVDAGDVAPVLAVPPPNAAAAPIAAVGAAPRASAPVRRPIRVAVREQPPGAWAPDRWPARVATGDSASVVAEFEARRADQALSTLDSGALAALADAARYAGQPELARAALLEQRRRFPRAPAAASAAFLLGRMTDDAGDARGGLAWYQSYLAEAPRGPYAGEALAREMLAVERLSGRGGARALADEYLRRFPNGTYLREARSIAEHP